MKKTLLSALLLFTGMLSAQIVNIPDAAFKNLLLSSNAENNIGKDINGSPVVIDLNNDGEIQYSEALNIYQLRAESDEIISYSGIESFTSLVGFVGASSNLNHVDFNGLSNLKSIIIDRSNTAAFNFYNLANLTHLSITGNLSSINISGLNNLESVVLDIDTFQELTLLNLPNLWYLVVGGNLESLTLPQLNNLKQLEIYTDELQNLNLSGAPNIENLLLHGTTITSLDISMLGSLSHFTISSATSISNLDLSNMAEIQYVWIQHCPLLQWINMKNGVIDDTYNIYLATGNTSLNYICLDQGEENPYIDTELYPNFHVTNYCTFTPGGDYNTITGTITLDLDNNGCLLSDAGSPNVKVVMSNGSYSETTVGFQAGNYNFYT